MNVLYCLDLLLISVCEDVYIMIGYDSLCLVRLCILHFYVCHTQTRSWNQPVLNSESNVS